MRGDFSTKNWRVNRRIHTLTRQFLPGAFLSCVMFIERAAAHAKDIPVLPDVTV